MLFLQFALAACLVLLFATKTAVVAAVRRGDERQAGTLHLLRLGLGLSATAYLLRIMGSAGSLTSIASTLCGFAGSLMIWMGFMGHMRLTRERLAQRQEAKSEQEDAPRVFATRTGLPYLNRDASLVLCRALAEAERQHQCVDTDHLLLGLLSAPGIPTGSILDRLGVKRENIRLALNQSSVPILRPDEPTRPPSTEPPLTERALAVFSLAAQEAHRFNKPSVGVEHLLLGLMLMGTGDAASALFQEGATVDGIRNEILKIPSQE